MLSCFGVREYRYNIISAKFKVDDPALRVKLFRVVELCFIAGSAFNWVSVSLPLGKHYNIQP